MSLQAIRSWFATSTLAHVAFGFITMGGWALFANRHHPLGDMLLAGLVQGTISGTLTLVLKKALERMNRMFARGPASDEGMGKPLAMLIVPPMITAATILAILVTAHTLAGTPEVVATIAVPFTVSTSYAIIYNWSLWKARYER